MPRTTRRLAIASLALALGYAGTTTAVAAGLDDILGINGVEHGITDDLPVITGDIDSGLAGLLGGNSGLLGGVLGTVGIVGDVLGGLGTGFGDGLGSDIHLGPVDRPDLSIQPVPTVGSGPVLENPSIGGDLLGGLLDVGSITGLLAGRL